MNRLYPGEPRLMRSLPSMKWNSIFDDIKLKGAARRRWHLRHCHLQSAAWRAIKVACGSRCLSVWSLAPPHVSPLVSVFWRPVLIHVIMSISRSGGRGGSTGRLERRGGGRRRRKRKMTYTIHAFPLQEKKAINASVLTYYSSSQLWQSLPDFLSQSAPLMPAYQVSLILRLVIALERAHSNHQTKL